MTDQINLTELLNQYAAAGAPACDSCDADQQVISDPDYPQVVHLNIMHDDDCPVLLRHENSRGAK
jgi:hypothetical protein